MNLFFQQFTKIVFVLLFSAIFFVVPMKAQKIAEGYNAPTLSATEVNKRLLKLIKNIRTVNDISPKNIERQMKIKVLFSENDRNTYGFGGKVGETSWDYNLVSNSIANKKPDSLLFSFNNSDENAEMKSICVDLVNIRKELTAAGFTAINSYGVHFAVNGAVFSRNNLFVHTIVNGSGKNYEEIKNNCVKTIIINAENAGKK